MSLPIAVIGAGLAGIACARSLRAAGYAPVLFDKGRGPGGRVATRRGKAPDGTALQWDHGAQYFSARDPGFAAALAAAGAVPWPDPRRFTGTPGISSIGRILADGLTIHTARHVTRLEGGPGAWVVHHADRALLHPLPPETPAGPFAAVAIALPAPQAAPIADPFIPALAARCAEAVYAPCWTVMAAFGELLPLPDTWRSTAGPVAWAARESAKPGRPSTEAWTIQAAPAWSREHLEDAPETIVAPLLAALGMPAPLVATAHRWRYSLVEHAIGTPCLFDADQGLGLAGDWCLGGRGEAAWQSGTALAEAIIARGFAGPTAGFPRHGSSHDR
ncbi:NAD(P)/FAD-dependent oxidoreductase [Humitalea sp. 24SJ18S-53]|uniref:NAD(P)/FAD-dependent oxidoreductase n=1 Tax=Humitalea sp. 24SJ18S-53 TaxID=3422307 RepID=UPI003D675B0E